METGGNTRLLGKAVGYGIGLSSAFLEFPSAGPLLWGIFPLTVSLVKAFPEFDPKDLSVSIGPVKLLKNPERFVIGEHFLFTLQSTQITLECIHFIEDKFRYYLYQLVLPHFAQLIGRLLFLHGGAFEVDSQAVGLVAGSGGGKSTLLSSFLDLGYNLIADDRVGFVLEAEEPLVVPSHPYLRNYRKEEDIGKPVRKLSEKILPLRTIFFLRWTEKEEPFIEKVEPGKAFQNLFSNSVYFPDVKIHARKILQWLPQMHTFRVFLPKGRIEKLPQVCNMILSLTFNGKRR
ncbi:hypothetical protein A946_04625 [Methylacidiphilum kamchatkense Kam1]|uniref:Hpr(Ser) kinase/phosphatase n=1 Tax=Methylacidiphilum kamchatkense Kam1 TaxID=1202785 RepID=A0A0C1RUS2_9BACT|nr:hypothetical protein [Methylacidiphilum kamchatkense]KIE58716.1 hypothetical protein A946_04625 [Methylacidiphilum kamchatkense Kam1]QDQ41888.1 hypothetical protein kam1_640 [Methylacidiphilum kamchatkense Kam1]